LFCQEETSALAIFFSKGMVSICGRYWIDVDERELRDICKAAAAQALPDEMTLKTSGEIFPTDTVPVMTGPETYQPMQWGFTQEGKRQAIINARSETVMERPMFKTPLLRHRCLIPCNGFYEWDEKKNKYLYHSPGRGLMLLAGIWRMERGARLPRFTILTREAVGDMADIHDRMPVIIPRELADTWLAESAMITDVIRQARTDIAIERVSPPAEPTLFDMV